jgi:hypothetical protein
MSFTSIHFSPGRRRPPPRPGRHPVAVSAGPGPDGVRRRVSQRPISERQTRAMHRHLVNRLEPDRASAARLALGEGGLSA